MKSWYSKEGKDCDVALYTKIVLSRNIKGFPFPNRMNDDQCSQVNELIINTLTSDDEFSSNFEIINFDNLPASIVLALKERGLITDKFAKIPLNKKLILSKDDTMSIMLCGEDHIRVTVLVGGMDLETAFNNAEEIDNLICSALPIAFDDRLGFLTESPMELGTALRAEVLLHLPSVEAEGEIRSIADSVSRIGLDIKGITNKDGYNKGSIYKLTNLITVGITERAAIENLSSIAGQIVNRERMTRDTADKINIEDTIFRAVALLKSARKIDIEEAVELISKLKLGVSSGIITDLPQHLPYKLLVESGDGQLQTVYGEMSDDDLEITRAEHIRKMLSDIKI